MNTLFPKQRLSYAEKSKDDFAWAKLMVDHIVQYSNTFSPSPGGNTDYDRKYANYQLYNNVINQKDFERELNPFGVEVGQFEDQIMPYNKTPNKIGILTGEELKTPFRYRTVLVNSDGIRSKELHKKELLKKYLNAQISAEVQKIQQSDEEVNTEGLVDPAELEHYMSFTYQEAREKLASDILGYLIRKDNLKEKKNEGFKHGLIGGDEMIWVGVINGEPTVKILNTLNTFYYKGMDEKYVQKGLFAGYKAKMVASDIIDQFHDDLTEEEIEKLEGSLSGVMDEFPDFYKKEPPVRTRDVYDNYLNGSGDHDIQGAYSNPLLGDIPVVHVEWRSLQKVGFITYTNEYGDKQMDIVSEDFVVPATAEKTIEKNHWGNKITKYVWENYSLEWEWIPQIWQAVKIGSDIYCHIGPKEYQYRSLDNPYEVSLGYYGCVYNNLNGPNVSLMDRMRPFQYLYLIVMDKFKKLIATDQGKVYKFDMSQISDKIGLEKTIYYLKQMNIEFFNPLSNAEEAGTYNRGMVSQSIDMSNTQQIANYINILDAIDAQISDVAGITRQREGQISSAELVSNAQANILQSATITESVYFYPHERIWEEVLNGLVQCAISCWRNKSIIKQYVLDDLSIQTLKLSPDDLTNADIAVFVSSLVDDEALFRDLKNLAQPLIQNDKANFSDLIKLYKATSSTQLEKHIEASEKKFQEQQMEQIRAQQEAQQAQIEAMMQLEREKMMNQRVIAAANDSDQGKLQLQAMIHEDSMAMEKWKIEQASKQKELDRKSREKISASKPKTTTK